VARKGARKVVELAAEVRRSLSFYFSHQSKDTGTPKESIHTSKYEQQVYENQRQEQQPGL
jgi:hypothetical protein